MNPTQPLLYTAVNIVQVSKRKKVGKALNNKQKYHFNVILAHYFSQKKENQKLSSISTQVCPLGPNK